MTILKFGEAMTVTSEAFKSYDDILSDPEVQVRFEKVASELKTIAPRAKDFLYFSAVMMHAAEAALLEDDGSLKKSAAGETLEASWDKSNDTWKWVCSDSNINPYKNANCFVPGTKVLMADGSSKNIEDVEIGDWVITHQNRPRRVTYKHINPYEGEVLDLKTSRNRQVTCTPNHPFYVLETTGDDSNKWRSIHNGKVKYSFKEAGSLKKGDILLEPVLNYSLESKISVDEARTLGLFCAEGNFRKNASGEKIGIILTFSSEEYDNLAQEAKELFEKTFKNATVGLYSPTPSQPSKCTLSVSGREVAEFCYKHVGEFSKEKKLSKDIVFASADVKRAFIVGWLEGDGHVDKDSGKIVGTTTSHKLSSQVRVILNSLKVNNCLYKELVKGHYNDDRFIGDSIVYRNKIPYNEAKQFIKNSNKLFFKKEAKEFFKDVIKDDFSLKPLLKKESKQYSGYVYNLEVDEDHSYVANDLIVHNCDIFPEEELIKAHKDWVGKPLCLDHKSSSVDMIRGVIVDTYYDYPRKRVVALCALDKSNYPDLAHKVTSRCATCVSMGTAVGRAICSDCGAVARTEADFCDHMRNKTCYGEINVDLKPIELSIVVNGADPKAKIRHIVASAANSIAEYISLRESHISKLAKGDKADSSEISAIKKDLESIMSRVDQLQVTAQDMGETGEELDIPSSEIKTKLSLLSENVTNLQQTVNKLLKNSEETNMTDKKAYHLGGGGVNDPASLPYDKEDYMKLRDKEDKQMNGEKPFPDVGSVDDLYPGDEEVKKKHLRAEEQKRAMRRQGIIEKAKKASRDKAAYHLGGGGVNDPATLPYDKEDYMKLRDKEDKQMVGEKPFPDVGAVDGLYPGDQELKQKLLRAKLKAKFIKSASPDGKLDRANSRWDVYSDKKLLLTATVQELTGNADLLFDSVANEGFGRKIISTLRENDFNSAKSILLKNAQAAPADPEPAMPAEPAMPEGAPMEDEMGGGLMDAGGDGDMATELPGLLDQMENMLADVRSGVDALMEQPSGELDELSEVAEQLPAAAASRFNKKLKYQKKVAFMLGKDMKRAAKELEDSVEELHMAQAVLETDLAPALRTRAEDLAKLTVRDSKKKMAGCISLMKNFVRFARGTGSLVKEAQEHGVNMDYLHESPLHDKALNRRPGLGGPGRGHQADLETQFDTTPFGEDPGAGYPQKDEDPFTFEFMDEGMDGFDADDKDMDDKDKDDKDDENDAKDAKDRKPKLKEHKSKHKFRTTNPEEWDKDEKKKKEKEDKEDKEKDSSKADDDELDANTGYSVNMDYLGEGRSHDEAMKRNPLHRNPGVVTRPSQHSKDPEGGYHQKGEDMVFDVDSRNAEDEMYADLDLPSGAKVTDLDGEDLSKMNLASEDEASIVVTADGDTNLTTKEGRAMARAKWAQKGLSFSPMLGEAHPGGGETTQLDTKPSGDLAKVETLEESHKQHMDVALAPPRVRKDAADIHELVVAGQIDPDNDFPALIANGLDPEAVKYWKQFYGQGDAQSSQFAGELVKEVQQKKMAEAIKANEVKVARAYELVYAMADKGLIKDDRVAISEQVKEVMAYDEAAFDSVKRFVEDSPNKKVASAMPQVGMDPHLNLPALPAKQAAGSNDLALALEEAFASPNYKPRNF